MAQFPELVTQYTVMTGSQQFALSHTRETGLSEAIIYIKAGSTDDIDEIERLVNDYVTAQWPVAVHGSQASGNIFDMLFSDREAPVVARLKRVDGKTPEPDQLTDVLGTIRTALPGVYVQQPEWNEYIELITDPERLALYDVSFSQILSYLRNSMNASSIAWRASRPLRSSTSG